LYYDGCDDGLGADGGDDSVPTSSSVERELTKTRDACRRLNPVFIGRYFLVFTIPIPKEILVGSFWYHCFGHHLPALISEHFGGKKIIRTFAPANTQGNLSRDKSLAIH
jgi:hypothetical protein